MSKKDVVLPMTGGQKLIKKSKKTNQLDLIYKADKTKPFHAHVFIDGSGTYSGVKVKDERSGKAIAEYCLPIEIALSAMKPLPAVWLKDRLVLPLAKGTENVLEQLERTVSKGEDLPELVCSFEDFMGSDWVAGLIVIKKGVFYVHKARRVIVLGPIRIEGKVVCLGGKYKDLFGILPDFIAKSFREILE